MSHHNHEEQCHPSESWVFDFRRQVDAARRLIETARAEQQAVRKRTVPPSILEALGQIHEFLTIAAALPQDHLLATISYLAEAGQQYYPILQHVLTSTAFDTIARGAAVTSLGIMFADTHNPAVTQTLWTHLINETETPSVRERCYFSMLLINGHPPFQQPVEQWNVLFDSFTFPRDVDWELLQERVLPRPEKGS